MNFSRKNVIHEYEDFVRPIHLLTEKSHAFPALYEKMRHVE